jgi:hypothetical protein
MTSTGATRVVVIAPSGSRAHDVRAGEAVIVGRARDCGIVIELPSISRHHVRITGGERPMVEDLGGTHGVQIAGRKSPVGQAVPVNRGDVVDIGGAMLVIHAADESALARWNDRLVELLARTNHSVVLMGEEGVGKTVAAEALVAESRGGAKLLDDVAAIPRETKERFIATTRHHDLSPPPGAIALLIPPLRDRPREIAPLAARLLDEAALRYGHEKPRISRDALGALVRHSWLGNVRELRATMEAALGLANGREIEPKHLVFQSVPLPPQTMQTLPPSGSD